MSFSRLRSFAFFALLLVGAACADQAPLDPRIEPNFDPVLLGDAQIAGRFSDVELADPRYDVPPPY